MAILSDQILDDYFRTKLDERSAKDLLRKLSVNSGLIDFCSNDYLGVAKDLNNQIAKDEFTFPKGGSTGSRLLTGNSIYAEKLENEIATFHNAPSGLIYNSGYDANLGLFSCIAGRGDTFLYDELIHASVRDGICLSKSSNYSFRHNSLAHLEKKLQIAKGNIFVAIESVYSMDGDFAPLLEICSLCEKYGAALIVDEAHATGVFGKNGSGRVQELGLEKRIFARVHTFGKALGTHGAIVLGSSVLRDYLINFSRSFIYTTALPESTLKSIKYSYSLLINEPQRQKQLISNITKYKKCVEEAEIKWELIKSESAIQTVIVSENSKARALSFRLREIGYDVRAILAPTVPKGKERLRICLHAFNSHQEIEELVTLIEKAIR
jgi:8-amino-7-oxononanoate synthase